MKKIILFISLFAFALSAQAQQNNIFLSKGFSGQNRTLISRAKRDLQRAQRLMEYAQKNFDQYKELLTSSRRSKRRRGERKTLSGKQYTQQAAIYYDKAYQQLFKIYYNYVKGLKYDLPENQSKAAELLSQAETSFNQGQRLLKSVGNYQEKELKRKVHFQKLMTTVKTGVNNELTAVQKLVQAINLFNQEEQQKQQLKKQDDQAWQNAVLQNTIEAYQDYINRFQNGAHVAEAQSKINELKQAAQQPKDTISYVQQTVSQPNPNLVYRIQVYAALHSVSAAKIRSTSYPLYGLDGRPTYYTKMGKYYKYFVGKYYTYKQAKTDKFKIRNNMKRSIPFVVGFYKNKPLADIHKAIAIEKRGY